jgi:hypothetical protein
MSRGFGTFSRWIWLDFRRNFMHISKSWVADLIDLTQFGPFGWNSAFLALIKSLGFLYYSSQKPWFYSLNFTTFCDTCYFKYKNDYFARKQKYLSHQQRFINWAFSATDRTYSQKAQLESKKLNSFLLRLNLDPLFTAKIQLFWPLFLLELNFRNIRNV